jgi:hypothetical protein
VDGVELVGGDVAGGVELAGGVEEVGGVDIEIPMV